MSDAGTILESCRAAGLRVERDGDCLVIRPADRVAPELLNAIRAHKPDLLALLDRGAPTPWRHVARQVLAGEFDGGTRSMLQSVLMGLRGSDQHDHREAASRIEALLGKRGRSAR